MWVPVPDAPRRVRVTRVSILGESDSGSPLSSANPSVNSRWVGGATEPTRHQPCGRSPSGPVMW